jgi:hypothetical protein
MKKHITTLSALALVIGGSINFTGCGGPSEDPNAVGEGKPATTMSDKDRKAAEKMGIKFEPNTGGKK